MENDLLRKLRENMKCLHKEEERLRLPLLSSTTKERRRAEVSRSPEKHMDQNISLKMRSHWIFQTKTEKLEGDLKRTRDQSYTKTMEILKLLAEKEELKVQIQELIKKNHQLVEEKEELCEEYKEYKEKLSRKISSEELGQLEKLRQENERLRCKAQKEAAEKAELLHENNDLKEELYRKIAVMSKLTVESEELQNKTEILTFKNIELTDEKEEIFRAYEEILCREELLRIGRCTLLTHRGQMEDKTEAQEKMKPQMAEYQLNPKWLKASVDKIKKSKEPGSNILRWLQKSLKLLKEDFSERSKHTLPEWLKASATNLPEECAKAAREDVNDWLEASINHLQEKGPETCELDVEGWLQASIIGIQHLQKFKSESRGSRKKKGWLAESIENLKKRTSCGDVTVLRVEGRKLS